MDNDVILRLKDPKVFGEHSYANQVHVMLTTDIDQWPCGMPFVADKSRLEEPRLSSVRGFTLFPPRQGVISDIDVEVPKECVKLMSLRPIVCRHRTVSIDAFDIGKFERLKNYVKDMNGITFVIKGKKKDNIDTFCA